MIHINKSSEPQELTSFKRNIHHSWKEIHQEANKHVYDACLQQCLMDQNELCGYTEMKLNESVQIHIDHYIKRDLAPQLTFEWSNMVAAVKDSRFGADFKDGHMDLANYDTSNHTYANAYNPVTDNMLEVFTFSSDGGIEPADKTDLKAASTIALFNLDGKELRLRRRECMESVRSLRLGGLTDQEIYTYLSPSGFISALKYEINQKDQ